MGFETKFREAKPDKSETVFQFVARLKRYLDRWTELAVANESMETLKDLPVREQLINTCSMELGLFLKKRVPKTVDEATQLAEQYLEAHGGTITRQKTSRDAQFSNRSSQRTHQQSLRQDDKPQDKRINFCFFCKKEGHFSLNCRAKERRRTVAAAREVGSDEQQGGRRPT